LLLIEGVWFFDFIAIGGDSRVKSKISFRAIDFVDNAGILSLQETSGGPGVVLVRYVLLLPASFGLEFPVPVLGSSSSVNWDQSWRQLASDRGLRDDVVSAFIVVWYGSFMAVLLLAIFKDDVASSIGVSALSFLLGFLLCCWRWRRGKQRRFRSTETVTSRSFYEGLHFNFILLWELLCKGLDVISLHA
jgi:hypothetical protein